ncbi:hypothetical protein ASAC_0126 [Acidilobus saccharovorans 345-15]|uniref:Uncharacterized protein n=1 Tax=Acidilobus saccharovorans (strain DSM 16705 / JCM 18335 / VKM B-2471 / 345-15) TaxID=666510 RepID=D9PZP6_ACIS3|nr:hypothetical protein [Acidilobus saccharovorans]ADL18534.1 hypothetical protein ASAC_0126 [Acidilobus saccharovorans 345-15]
MSQQGGPKSKAAAFIVLIALAVVLISTNVAWYFNYTSLQSRYNRVYSSLQNVTGYALSTAKLLNESVKLLKDYENLTKYLNTTIDVLNAERSLLITNVSLELNLIAVKSFDAAVNLTIEANQTPSVYYRYELVTAASEAANLSVEAIKSLQLVGAEAGANSTLTGYLSQAEQAAQNLSVIAKSLVNGPDPQLQGKLTSVTDSFLSSLLRAESYIISLARTQSTS